MSIAIRELASGCDLLSLAAANPARYPCVLESVAHGTAQARYDILFAFPQSLFRLDADGSVRDGAGIVIGTQFLDVLSDAWRAESMPLAVPATLPFQGGWVLYLGYELAGQIEPKLHLPLAPGVMPVALALRCPAAIILDHGNDRMVAIAETEHSALLDALAEDMASMPPLVAKKPVIEKMEEDAPARFLEGVQRTHEYLRAGDVFQINLSREWRGQLQTPITSADVYAALRQTNPAPFAGLLQMQDWAIVSSSPERLVEIRQNQVQVRPIAGTRPRLLGDNDALQINELVEHPKERAEHIMLIDLERNDLGRVCKPGSIEVNEMMTVESYAHVHHIVSNVRGQLRDGTTPAQVIRAVFPGGTITGCPKVRCMEIIAELEGTNRGAYTGSLGYLNRNGDLDLNILIRTLTMQSDQVRLRTGAGIVVDSVAEQEFDETRAKARGMLLALGIAFCD